MMSEADDTVRSRLRNERERASAEALRSADTERRTLLNRLGSDVPAVLELLRERDYPNAELIEVTLPSRGRRRRAQFAEKAGWLVAGNIYAPGDRNVVTYLLADGTMCSKSYWPPPQPVELEPFVAATSVEWLREVAKGVAGLLAHLFSAEPSTACGRATSRPGNSFSVSSGHACTSGHTSTNNSWNTRSRGRMG